MPPRTGHFPPRRRGAPRAHGGGASRAFARMSALTNSSNGMRIPGPLSASSAASSSGSSLNAIFGREVCTSRRQRTDVFRVFRNQDFGGTPQIIRSRSFPLVRWVRLGICLSTDPIRGAHELPRAAAAAQNASSAKSISLASTASTAMGASGAEPRLEELGVVHVAWRWSGRRRVPRRRQRAAPWLHLCTWRSPFASRFPSAGIV